MKNLKPCRVTYYSNGRVSTETYRYSIGNRTYERIKLFNEQGDYVTFYDQPKPKKLHREIV